MKKQTLAVAAAFAAFAAFAAQAALKPAYDTLISHRGESVDAPENTLPAFKTAVERGFGFECDVYLSADKRVFTFHDSTLTRTTDGANTNRCADANWENEISKLDVGGWGKWKGSRFEGTRPALLEEVLALARDGRYIYVEVKPGPEIVPYIRDIVRAQKTATPKNMLFIAFNADTCAKLKEQLPEYKVYWLTSYWVAGKPVKTDYVVGTLKRIKADGVDCAYNPKYITKEFIDTVKKAGFEFHVWTVDSLPVTLKAFKSGAQTVTTNCALKQLKQYEARKKNKAKKQKKQADGK